MDIYTYADDCSWLKDLDLDKISVQMLEDGSYEILHPDKPETTLIIKCRLEPSLPGVARCGEEKLYELSSRFAKQLDDKINELDSNIEGEIEVSKAIIINKDCRLFDKHGFEFSIGANIERLLQKNNIALLTCGLDFEFDEGDNADLCWGAFAILFPDYVSPLGKMFEMLSYINEVIDAPGMPGCNSGFREIQKELKN